MPNTRYAVVSVSLAVGVYDGRFQGFAVADREHANRITGPKFRTRADAETEAARLNARQGE